MPVEEGFIVLADVSGYGEFIATTELEHSREILGELLATLCECAPGKLMVAQIEGDAVFWLAAEEMPDLVDLLRAKFVEFHRRLRFIKLATTCTCRACASAGALTLKFIVHRGSYVRQRIAGSDHFVGNDLVLAHRLLKNSIPSHEYILLTGSALAAVNATEVIPHTEAIDHIGSVDGGYLELSDLRERALAERTEHLEAEEAELLESRIFPVSVERVRDIIRGQAAAGWRGQHYQFLDEPPPLGEVVAPAATYEGTHDVTRSGARGTALGEEIHCHHAGDIDVMRVVRSERDESGVRTTMHIIGTRGALYLTQILDAMPTGSRFEIRVAAEPVGDPAAELPPPIVDLIREDVDHIAAAVRAA